MTRKDYLDGVVTHAAYYSSVADEAGVVLSLELLARVRKALAAGDASLNSIPLKEWDDLTKRWEGSLRRALRKHEDLYSLAGGVCALKQAAREYATNSGVLPD